MKKRLTLFLSFFTLLILVACLWKGGEKCYAELCISEAEMQEIMADRSQASQALYKEILFNEYALIYDNRDNRFFYSLVENSETAYNPYVKCVSAGTDVRLAIVGREITDEVIRNGEEFGLLFYTDKEYEYVKLAFTTLPLLSVEYEGELSIDEDIPAPMKLRMFDNREDATQRIIDAAGEIHYRGRSSRYYPKKAFRFTLYTNSVGENRRENKTALLGLREDGDWILYAAYNDDVKVRNVFSSKIWKESSSESNSCGVDNGMEYKWTELFVNGQYWGLYALGYPIDATQLKMTAGEYMYAKTEPGTLEKNIDPYSEGAIEPYRIRKLGVNAEESWEPLSKFYIAMRDSSDSYAAFRKITDRQNSIDLYLFLNLIQGVDHADIRGANLTFNLYLTNKFCEGGTRQVMLYTPWDMDRTWGKGFASEGRFVTPDQNVIMETNLVHFLLEEDDEEIKEQLVQRYYELRESTWSEEHLLEILNTYEKQIFLSGAYARDITRWPETNANVKDLSEFKKYVLERLSYMDIYIQQIK